MKSNINKLILIEVIAGILLAFIASKILHMTEALQIMYLPFELIGKGLRFLSLSSAIGNVIAIIIYVAISMIPAIYVIYQRKRGRTHKEDILLVAFTGLLFYVHQSRTHVSENARHFFNGPKQSDCNENYLRIHRLQRPDHVVDHESDPFSWR